MFEYLSVNFCLAVGGIFFPQKKLVEEEEVSRIGTKLSFSILMVGVFGRGPITVKSVDAFRIERHSAGIELMILVRKIFVRDLQVEYYRTRRSCLSKLNLLSLQNLNLIYVSSVH